MIELAALGRLHLRSEKVWSPVSARIAYLSDLHLAAWNTHVVRQIVDLARQVLPEVFLLGGDLVDHYGGLAPLGRCIHALAELAPVWVIPGNHDHFVGIQCVRECVETAGGEWLPGESRWIGDVQIDGSIMQRTDPGTSIRVLLAHDPAIFPRAQRYHYTLVLAGHLHGSQFVLGSYRGRLYPGALFYRWNGDRFHSESSAMIVSRGINDTLPIRWNCRREMILCDLGPD
jgi:predicted MPP superfamily phosphohydrolase